jgi:bifunctional non-homologous end joining protein LigD
MNEPIMRAHDLTGLIAWGAPDPFAGIAGRWLTPGWAAELKINGHRGLATFLPGRVRLTTPRGGIRTEAAPDLARIALPGLAGTVLDGEITAPPLPGDPAPYGAFPATGGWLGSGPAQAAAYRLAYGAPLMFWAFDILASAGQDWTRRPYTERRAELKRVVARVLAAYPGCGLLLMPQVPATAASIQAALDAGHEGVMLKRRDSLYRPGTRSADWQKVKATATIDVFLTGAWRPGEGGRSGTVGSVEVAVLAADRTVQPVGFVAVKPNLAGQYTDPADGGLRLDRVGEVWEVETNGRTAATGQLRHARFLRTRPDKQPEQCEAGPVDDLPVAA